MDNHDFNPSLNKQAHRLADGEALPGSSPENNDTAAAAEAIRLGLDGIIVSNHGGRQLDAEQLTGGRHVVLQLPLRTQRNPGGNLMSVLYFVLPLALLIAVVAVGAFIWAVHGGQLDDLETPAIRMLHDDVD